MNPSGMEGVLDLSDHINVENKQYIEEYEPELDLEESVIVMQEELTKEKQRAMDKRIAYKKAVEEFESGRAKSYKLAAKRFGVSDVVVRRMVLGINQRGFTSPRRRYPFTSEEQKNLKDTILLATNNGKDLSVTAIRDFIAEEASNIVRQFPERCEALSNYIDPQNGVAYYFAKKHGLDKIIKETAQSKNIRGRRIYECDSCDSSFIYKNSMISHKREVHLYLSEY